MKQKDLNDRLICAAEQGDVDELKNALKLGAEVNACHNYLYSISEKQYSGIIATLIDNGITLSKGNQALLRYSARFGMYDNVKKALDKGANFSIMKFDAVRKARKNGYMDIVKLFMDNIEILDKKYQNRLSEGFTSMEIAQIKRQRLLDESAQLDSRFESDNLGL